MTMHSISGTTKEIAGDTETALGDAIGDRGAQIGGRLRSAEARGERLLAGAREAIGHAASEAADHSEDAYQRGIRSVRSGSATVAGEVRGRPLAALLVAGLAGYGLGLLLHARR
ncbi:CsbD family protein [Methylobacterium durans]|uniref:CsbD family protein n=1 Tax=Methylobacterium durans TaxID=2202825 RepID=UPI002AFEDEF5|nr:CsbD family protein [Methylobacterium durans]MEA1833821.1 CsbD family protein [Methylobacterium durans]